MSKIIIGIDPDSKAHGVAVYVDGRLIALSSMELFSLYECIEQDYQCIGDIEIHIENVCGNNSVFRQVGNKNVQQSMGRRLGMCQQSQIEVERMAQVIGVKVVKHKISKMWKKDKSQFERVTGWSGRSNEDTRSAAWMGWLGVSK